MYDFMFKLVIGVWIGSLTFTPMALVAGNDDGVKNGLIASFTSMVYLSMVYLGRERELQVRTPTFNKRDKRE
jgi:hypothetical protein